MTPERVRWAVAQLQLSPAAHVLEIGCGGGHALALVAERLTRGAVVGIDRSETQVRSACVRNAESIAGGRVRVERLTIADAPARLGEQAFQAVFAVNVNAFWTDAERSLNAARRLIRKRGRLYLFYEPPSAARLASLEAALPPLLEAQSLRVSDVRSSQLTRSRALCVIGVVG